jgi:sialate O-acetylesterase
MCRSPCLDSPTGELVARAVSPTHDVSTEYAETLPYVRNSPNSELEGFALCDNTGKWIWADARIEGNRVLVQTAPVIHPIAIRYCWANFPVGNLFNQQGFPARPFEVFAKARD